MKKRIQVDSTILVFIIALTGFFCLFPFLYPASENIDNVMDFVGMIILLKGTVIRMIARGHKKSHSGRGKALVTSGIYKLTRNPMYLGSFYMGAGFVLIVWPWWTLPFFAWLFYARFHTQVVQEEKHLKKEFGSKYTEYCQKVPRVFPTFDLIRKTKTREIINTSEVFSTKETRGLLWWPILAVILETIQENIVYYGTDIRRTIFIFIVAMAVFASIAYVQYMTRD